MSEVTRNLTIGWSDSARPASDGYGGIASATHAVPLDSDKALCGYAPGDGSFTTVEEAGGIGCRRCQKAIERLERAAAEIGIKA